MALSDCGTLVSLVGDDGNRHFYGHLSVWEGGSRRVGASEVIGYVGATGQTKAPVWGGGVDHHSVADVHADVADG